VLQCVAACCSVLPCVEIVLEQSHSSRSKGRCSVLQCVAVCFSVLQCIAVCCGVWQCVAVWCNVVQCVAACCNSTLDIAF